MHGSDHQAKKDILENQWLSRLGNNRPSNSSDVSRNEELRTGLDG